MPEPLDRATCEEAFRQLDDYLDHRLSPEQTRSIEEHLRICAACTREFTFEASLLRGVRRKLRRVVLPPDLLARLAAQLTEAAEAEDDEDP